MAENDNHNRYKRKSLAIDITTKVVDNYGDAAVALRLLRSLASVKRDITVRLFIDDPQTFEKLLGDRWEFTGPGSILTIQDMTVSVFDWKALPAGSDDDRPDLLIEMFGGGLPGSYLETRYSGRPPRDIKTLWINLEHLTAEEWAADYHLISSHSPDPNLERFFFMPGFRKGLGGLLMDSTFHSLKSKWDRFSPGERNRERRLLLKKWGVGAEVPVEKTLWLSIFSYEKNFSSLIDQLANRESVTVLLSPGQGSESFLRDLKKSGIKLNWLQLPFLSQEEWDEMLLACDINFVRGEESLSRAALSGRPFLWQAYRIDDGAHMNKVSALCSILCPESRDMEDLFIQYNRDGGEENFNLLLDNGNPDKELYKNFSKIMKKNGNCTDQLILFFDNYIKLSAS